MADETVAEVEEWRTVPGHPGYEASSLGRVRSLDRWIARSDGRRCLCQGRMLQAQRKGYRYHGLNLGRGCSFYVHTLICAVFHGLRPSQRHEVSHRNGNCLDNRASNLRWVTHQQNEADKVRHGTNSEGQRHGMVKLTEPDVLEIRHMYACGGMSPQEIADSFSVSRWSIRSIVTRASWRHLP